MGLEPWEQDMYLEHFVNRKKGAYNAKPQRGHTREGQAEAWRRFLAAQER